MNSKKRKCSMSDAVKIYNISGLFALTAFSCIAYLLLYIVINLILFKDSQSSIAYILPAGFFVIASFPFMNVSFEKKLPGGKYLRSVPDGFEIFKKVKYAMVAFSILPPVVCIAVICIVNLIKPFMPYGTATCILIAVFSIAGTGINNIIQAFTGNSIISVFILFFFPFQGFIAANGKPGVIQITAAGITAVIFLFLSLKININNYKKKHWIY